MGVSFIGGGNRRKPPILPQVTDKLYHIMLYLVHPTWVGFELTTLVVIGTDCIGSCPTTIRPRRPQIVTLEPVSVTSLKSILVLYTYSKIMQSEHYVKLITEIIFEVYAFSAEFCVLVGQFSKLDTKIIWKSWRTWTLNKGFLLWNELPSQWYLKLSPRTDFFYHNFVDRCLDLSQTCS